MDRSGGGGHPQGDRYAGPVPRLEPPQTAQAVAAVISELTDTAWVLAAVVDVLGRGMAATYPANDGAARVLAAAGLFQENGSGYAPASGIAALMAEDGPARVEAARSALGQVATVAMGGRLGQGWVEQDDETLLAQGAASGCFVASMLPIVFERLPQLEDRVRTAGARFLDVGVGTGAMACALAEALPSLSIVGIDSFDRALRLASQRVADRGLEERVSLAACGVEALDAEETFDVAWLPAPFIPGPAFTTGLARLYRALRPGGWILVGMGRLEGSGLSGEVTRWQTELIGGTALTPGEARTLLVQAGFSDFVILDTPPRTPVVVAARRLV